MFQQVRQVGDRQPDSQIYLEKKTKRKITSVIVNFQSLQSARFNFDLSNFSTVKSLQLSDRVPAPSFCAQTEFIVSVLPCSQL